MKVKMLAIIKLFIPPIAWVIAGKIRALLGMGKSQSDLFEFIPAGWDYMKSHPEVKGWNVQDILEVYKAKLPAFITTVKENTPLSLTPESDPGYRPDVNNHNTIMVFAYALAFSARQRDAISLLDWGGGIGQYYLLSQAILPGIMIDYHCKDVPVLATYGQSLFPDAHFYQDDKYLSRTYDFVLVSGSLQYVENWEETLRDLTTVTNDYILITRLPVIIDNPAFVFIQRPYRFGYNTEYLAWCLNRESFLDLATKLGLSLIREFVVGDTHTIEGAPEQCKYCGFLFQKRTEH